MLLGASIALSPLRTGLYAVPHQLSTGVRNFGCSEPLVWIPLRPTTEGLGLVTYRNRTGYLAIACLGVLALTSCTENLGAGRPSPSESVTSPATSTPSATPTSASPASPTPRKAPARPSAANGLTLAAGEAFVYHYSDLANYAATTGDTTALLAASDSGCGRCRAYADVVKKANAANGALKGNYQERVKEVTNLVRGKAGRLRGSAILTVGTYTSSEVPNAKPVVIKATTYRQELALSPQGGNWVMYEMKLVEQ